MSSTSPIRMGLIGGTGRLGRAIQECLSEAAYNSRLQLSCAPIRGEIEPLKAETAESLLACDVILEVGIPEMANKLAAALLSKAHTRGTPLPAWVSGSTGWTGSQRTPLLEWGKSAPVLWSSNFSTGVLAFQHVLRQASPLLKRLGYTPVLTEVHHQHKRDAPSGTGRSLQAILSPNAPESIQTHAIRAGEVVGDHSVEFFGTSDRIRIEHSAMDRKIFARGALEVALWLAEQRQERTIGVQTMENFFERRYIQG